MKSRKQIIIYGLMITCMITSGTALGFGAAVVKQRLDQQLQISDLSDIMRVQERLTPGIMGIEGVVGIGIGQYNGSPCIEVLLVNDSANLKAKIPTLAEGYRIITEVIGPIIPFNNTPPIVRQSGGMGILLEECGNNSYRNESANYIIEGTVEHVESGWDDAHTGIFTTTELHIEKYVKGTPFERDILQIVTPGGRDGNITQWVEDQPIFHEGKHVRIYLVEIEGELFIFCGFMGVEEL